MSSSKTKRLAIDTILFGISTFGSKILVFLLTPLYTAVLLTEEFGVADLINTTVNLLYPVFTLAITDATLRYALDKNCSKQSVLDSSLVIVFLSTMLLCAFYPVVTGIHTEVTEQIAKYWIYFIATYTLHNLHLCFSNFIKGIGKTKLFAIQGILLTATVVLCNIYFLLVAKIGLQGYLLSIIIGYIVPVVFMFFVGKIYKYLFPFSFDKKLFFDMLKYSIPMIPTLLAWSINMYTSKFMLIGLLPKGVGLGESGIYSVANKIPSLLTAVLSIFTQAWQLSAISNVNDSDESEYYSKTYTTLNIVSLVGCLLIVPFSKPASSILFDPSYYSAWQYIPFLTVSAYFSCLSGFLAAAFRAYKKTGHLFVSVAISALVNIVLNFILIKTIGVLGTAIATALSFIVTWLIRMIKIQSMVKLKINVFKTVVNYILTILGCLLISFDVPYAYVVYAVMCVVIVILNFKDILGIFASVISILKKLITKLKGSKKQLNN